MWPRLGHDLVNGNNRPFCAHHGCGTDFEHHQYMGLLTGAECRNARIQRFRIIALMIGSDDIVALACIEGLDLFGNKFAIFAGECMLEIDLSLRGNRGCHR